MKYIIFTIASIGVVAALAMGVSAFFHAPDGRLFDDGTMALALVGFFINGLTAAVSGSLVFDTRGRR